MPRALLAMANIGPSNRIRDLLLERGSPEAADEAGRTRGRVAYLEVADTGDVRALGADVRKAVKQSLDNGARKLFVHVGNGSAMTPDAAQAFWIGMGFRYLRDEDGGRAIYVRNAPTAKKSKPAKANGAARAKSPAKKPAKASPAKKPAKGPDPKAMAEAFRWGKSGAELAAKDSPSWSVGKGTLAERIQSVIETTGAAIQMDGGHPLNHTRMTKALWAEWYRGATEGARIGLLRRYPSLKPQAAPAKANGARAAAPAKPRRYNVSWYNATARQWQHHSTRAGSSASALRAELAKAWRMRPETLRVVAVQPAASSRR